MEQQLMNAATNGLFEEAEALLRDNPSLHVNWKNGAQQTALHCASQNGHAEVVKLLLAHPEIDVNVGTGVRETPFLLSCWLGKVSVARLLLKDPRVDVTSGDLAKRSPLWCAALRGCHDVIEWLIASGRDLGDLNLVEWLGKKYSVLEIARNEKMVEVVSLLKKFVAKPAQTRHELRLRLAPEELAAEVYTLTIFLCDDLLRLKPALITKKQSGATHRFFGIVRKLPMELQMIICHRVVGSGKESILSKDSEAAFKSLARFLLSQST